MKTIDVNMKTLEQEQQYLKQTSGIVRVEAICFAVALFVLMVQDVLASAPNNGESLSPLFWVKLAFLPLQTIALIVTVNFVIKLFKEIETGETPFRYSVADKLKGMSDAILAGSVVLGAPGLIITIVNVFTNAEGSSTTSFTMIMLGGLFLGALFKALSYIFAFGCRLQQESDETL